MHPEPCDVEDRRPRTIDRRRTLEELQDRVDALTRPITTRETVPTWDERRCRTTPRVVVLEHPSLLEQLADPASSGTAGRAAPGFKSRPTANLAAVDLTLEIRDTAAAWVRHTTHRAPSPDLPANLHTLAARAHDLSDDELAALAADVLRWWASARVVSGWDVPPFRPAVRCMACERLGGIRVRLEPISAVCLDCGSAWDASTIGVLAEHLRLLTAPTPVPV